MKYLTTLFGIWTLIQLSGCYGAGSTADQKKTEELQGKWELEYIYGMKNTFADLYPEQKPFIIFNTVDNQVSGNTGCNAFRSGFTREGRKMRITQPGAITIMACPGEGEVAFLQVLEKVTNYEISKNTLNLIMGDIVVMRFVRQPEE